jgi:hypothetical protein
MMEVARTSETLVNFYQTTRRYNPEDSHLSLVMSVQHATAQEQLNIFQYHLKYSGVLLKFVSPVKFLVQIGQTITDTVHEGLHAFLRASQTLTR